MFDAVLDTCDQIDHSEGKKCAKRVSQYFWSGLSQSDFLCARLPAKTEALKRYRKAGQNPVLSRSTAAIRCSSSSENAEKRPCCNAAIRVCGTPQY